MIYPNLVQHSNHYTTDIVSDVLYILSYNLPSLNSNWNMCRKYEFNIKYVLQVKYMFSLYNNIYITLYIVWIPDFWQV